MVNNYLGDNRAKRDYNDYQKSPTERSDQIAANRGDQGSHDISRSNSECSILSNDNNQGESGSVRKDRTSSMASYQSNYPKGGSVSGDTPKLERTVRFSGRVSKMSCVSHHGMSRVCLREAAAEKQVSIFALFISSSAEA